MFNFENGNNCFVVYKEMLEINCEWMDNVGLMKYY